MSVAIVMDDGSLSGTTPPAIGEVEQLVAAAMGLDEERGDSVAVTAVPFPAEDEAEEAAAPAGDMVDLASRIAAVVVLVVITVVLILMLRRRKKDVEVIDITREPAPTPALVQERTHALHRSSVADIKAEVTQLVEEQPEDIAVLLRSWLADRRS